MENVWETASFVVLLEDSRGRTHQNVLHHGCFKRLVGFGLLDSADKSSSAHIISRKQVASLHARWKSQDVLWMDWFRTTKRAAHALRCRLNLPSLWHRALATVYGWAGHVARKDASHPGHAAIL